MNTPSRQYPVNDYKLIAKLGLCTGVSGLVGVLCVLWLIGDREAKAYGDLISAVGELQQTLAPALWLFGFVMVTFAGLMTGLFALYASFRVAGPLFRIAQDIEEQIRNVDASPLPIRAGDKLQAEWRQFEAGVAGLQAQRVAIGLALNPIQNWTEHPHPEAEGIYLHPLVAKLTEVEQRVKL